MILRIVSCLCKYIITIRLLDVYGMAVASFEVVSYFWWMMRGEVAFQGNIVGVTFINLLQFHP